MMRWQKIHFEQKETIVTFFCRHPYQRAGEEALRRGRTVLEEYIRMDPKFSKTHTPHEPTEHAPELIKEMCRESKKVNVGPMAAVAGTLAHLALEAIINAGANEAVVDNGGDIAMSIRKPIRIGIFSGKAKIQNIAFEVSPRKQTFGICTSSGTVGHSFSYGKADAAVIVSENIALADAAATALGNRIQSKEDLNGCFQFLESEKEIEGALVIYQDRIALWGNLPKLVRSQIDIDLITRGMTPEEMETMNGESDGKNLR